MESQGAKFGSVAALVAGPMWIAYYGIDLLSGVLGTRDPETLGKITSPQTFAALLFFNGAIVGFNAANLGLFRSLGGRSRGWGIAGLVFAALAALFALTGFGMAAFNGPIRGGIFSGMGVMTTCVATTLMGIAVLRARTLPGAARFLPLFVGLFTFPFIVTVTSIFAFLPEYVTSEFPFAFSGLCWIAIGLALRVARPQYTAPRAELVAA